MTHNLRLITADVIKKVMEGQALTDALRTQVNLLPQEMAFVQALSYGVCRFYPRLTAILKYLLAKPLKRQDNDIYALLLMGLYQLLSSHDAHYAIVNETVHAVAIHKKWAKALVNALLRRFLREQKTIEKNIDQHEEAFYAHPAWMITKLKKAWMPDWKTILLANNQHPPFMLRVNLQKISRENYLTLLKKEELNASIIPETSSGICLDKPCSVQTLPGFAEGMVSVQDGGAQLAAGFLALQPGLRVLDACAAPGGKLAHILETESALGEVIAFEIDATRLQLIEENLKRLKLTAKLYCQDAGLVDHLPKHSFDRILLDAPCSASGVIRRHPDIKLLRRASDIPQLVKEQIRLLTALWPLLKPGGLLLYATCSIFPEENESIIESFLAQHAATSVPLNSHIGLKLTHGLQILPGLNNMDGFYYSLLKKNDI